MKKIIFLPVLLYILFSFSLVGQVLSNKDKALKALYNSATQYGLNSNDLKDLKLSDQYKDEHNGVEHFYFQQTINEIPIYNAITSVHIGHNDLMYSSDNRFIVDIVSKVNTNKAKISALQALKSCISHYKIEGAILPKNSARTNDDEGFFEKTNFTHSDIPYKLIYVLYDNKLRIAWDLSINMKQSADHWNVRVDAVTGQVIDENNFTVYCKFHNEHHQECKVHTEYNPHMMNENKTEQMNSLAAPMYNVVPLPTESPIHGPRKLITNPADIVASKFGWHTTKSDGSAEFTNTRGNNVYAYLDADGDNTPDPTINVNGGATLNFDFPFDETQNPEFYRPAAITNLFYMCNMMHDITYKFGFTEVAGNFQVNTYGKGGITDRVNAEAQDFSGVDNANFSTPSDGQNGRMQMYLWNASSDITVTEPFNIAGDLPTTKGNFGAAAPTIPIIAEVILSNDGSSDPDLGCKNTQTSKMKGKIAIIRRGICEFGAKALYAQNAGAVAVIIAGFDEASIRMDGGASGSQVTIPAYFIKASVYNRIKSSLAEGKLIIKIEKPSATDNRPEFVDGDFDNGIIAHEYGHGVSTRLTGGPSNSGCLGNGEQMGEGWSDFFSLVTTVKAGDKSDKVRGIGNYATVSGVDGVGIRRRPYTTNRAINEFTYKDLTTSEHDNGEVWAMMLWDLYWALVDKYGFDTDFNNKTSGNNIAIQLVMDGMKLQPCSPGFVDGRNAILAADRLNNRGENQCLIWDIFAKRGVGFKAKQGNSNVVGDEEEDFNSLPSCINSTLITKTADLIVKAGSDINYTITVNNSRLTKINNVIVTDNIPLGCSYVIGSANVTPKQVSATSVVWEFASLDSFEIKTIKYKLKTDPGIFSNTVYIDDLEAPDILDRWEPEQLKGEGYWFDEDGVGFNGTIGYRTLEAETVSSDAGLFNPTAIKLPDEDIALLFLHKYLTQKNVDGGFVQISVNNKTTYNQVAVEDWAINGYNGNISYSAISIPNNKGFTGYVADFVPSVLDLKNYRGKTVNFRFRFGNDDQALNTTIQAHKGWTIDNIEIINPKYYNAELCVTSSTGENICKSLEGRGTLVDSKKVVATNNSNSTEEFTIFPNPARDRFVVKLNDNSEFNRIELYSINGQLLRTESITKKHNSYSTNGLPKGMMIIKLIGTNSTKCTKLSIN